MAYEWLPPGPKHRPLWPGEKIEEIKLPNGLVLEVWDYSRKLAGDRWLVGLLVQIAVPVEPERFSSPELYHRFQEETGGVLYYRYRKERHFVAVEEKEKTLGALKENFLRAALDYLSHPQFRERFLETEVPLWEQRLRWQEEIRRRDEEAEKEEGLWKDRPL